MTARSEGEGGPRVWLLMGHKAGDNSQVLTLAEALGWPFEIKRFVYRPTELATNLLLGPTLAGAVMPRSSRLAPPWPDLVLTAGRRNEPIARWIQAQAGGPDRIKLVHFGRPWAPPGRFDLIITTPQYGLPRLANVLHNDALIHRVTPERLDREAASLAPRVAHLPRPYIAVLVGGDSGPYRFREAIAERLAREASALAEAAGGSLLVTTSARTPAPSADRLESAISAPMFFYRWTAKAPDNPYFGLLGLADAIVVTAESISMITEACAAGKPVHFFDIGEGTNTMRIPASGPGGPPAAMPSLWGLLREFNWKALVHWTAMRCGPKRMRRDIRIIQQNLIASDRAVWLGEGTPRASPPPLEDLDRAVARVHALFDPATTGEARQPPAAARLGAF
jgi:mitochondrial fission protein ELM1